ncbi:hypothetical protein B0T10DRAFT_462326 [Thelonectria olida]|uniref:Uncharacterized protein n=1 Tax=Thelonectria olida TaxID=1576542 RepID=A0A9P8VYK2_9HYPO|nr:hypothetical protein B0T10DRAFT_462326 [Thelonectria olida]
MSYYDNPQSQWSAPAAAAASAPAQNNWDHQQTGSTTPVRAGASGPQPQDDYAFSYQFEEVDRAYENLQKSGKGYGMGGRHGRTPHGAGPRPHSVNNFDDARGSQGPNLQNFYANQRHQPSRGSNEAEQVMQAKRRMAAQRERELRNLHTEQQYQRTLPTIAKKKSTNRKILVMGSSIFYVAVISDITLGNNNAPSPSNSNRDNNRDAGNSNNKHMSEEETRELIARQRSALYGEGPFADKSSYVDETGAVRTGPPGTSVASGPSSIRGHSPLAFDNLGRAPPAETGTPGSDNPPVGEPTSRPQSTTSPQGAGPTNKVFDNAVGLQSRTSTSSPTGASPPRDLAPGSKPGQSGNTVAPIGTRPSGTPASAASSKRSTTPLASPGGWGRGNGVWGQSSGLGAPASVWG